MRPAGARPVGPESGGCAARPTGYLHARLRRERLPGRSTENSEEPLSQHPLVAAYLVKGGIHYKASLDLLIASQDLGMLNVAVRPRLLLLSLPLLIVTRGLFALFMNAVLLYVVGWLLKPSFQVDGFSDAFWGVLVITLVSLVLNSLTGQARITMQHGKPRPPSGKSGGGSPVIDV